jgi:hypothetical protein
MPNNGPESQPLVVNPKGACRMLDCGTTRLYALLGTGQLESFCDGRSRKITLASIHRYIARKLSEIDGAGFECSPRRRGEV